MRMGRKAVVMRVREMLARWARDTARVDEVLFHFPACSFGSVIEQ